MRVHAIALLILLGAAGCTPDTATPNPTLTAASPPAASTAPTAGVVACVAGDWSTTAVSASASTPTAQASIEGGKGVVVRISPDGTVEMDFSTMDPISFTAKAADIQAKGRFFYRGKATGHVQTTAATATSGSWVPVGTVDWSTVRITVDMTEPLPLRVVDDAALSTYTGDKTGGSVDAAPLLGKGTFSCTDRTLTLSAAQGLSWQLERRISVTPLTTGPAPNPTK